MQKQKNKERGITLIALVVSIIVLIILAGVFIAMLVGKNGIIMQAQRADELTTQAQQKEAIELAVASIQAQGTLELDRTKLETALQSQLGDTAYTLTENEDGSYLLQIGERSYYIDGTGKVITEDNMIAIGTAEELKAFRDDVNSGNTYEGWYVYLTNNITLDINEEWEPIGSNENNIFRAIFDGKNFIISNIVSTALFNCQGTFGFNNGIIKNLSVSGNIKGQNYIGGICGRNEGGTITNCKNFISIEANDNYVGGITGRNNSTGVIKNCYNNQIVKGKELVGGIAGESNGGSVTNCCNIGNIEGEKYIGGIIGRSKNKTSVEMCYNSGEIKGDYQVGGIIGFILGEGTIKNSYNTGNIAGVYTGIGGIVGINGGIIWKCYNTGSIAGTDSVGAISGRNDMGVEDCYCPTNITLDGSQSENTKYSVERLNDEQMKTLQFVEILNNGQNNNIWKIDINLNDSYPILQWQ